MLHIANAVADAVQSVIKENPTWFTRTDQTRVKPEFVEKYYLAVQNALDLKGYCVGMLNEEVSVRENASAGYNFDILRSDLVPTWTYKTTCHPAILTKPYVAPSPTPTPTPAPDATHYPQPVRKIDIRLYNRVGVHHWVFDATAKSCGPNPDFPGRQCWPSCGPEGAHPEGCDASLKPVWHFSGVGPLHEVRENPWQFHVTPGITVWVCSGTVCSDHISQ